MARDILLEKADKFAHLIFQVTKNFPREELFGLTSQLRRAALSIPLNMVEGFARQNRNEHRRFLEISYGSLKEAVYLLEFSFKEEYLGENDFKNISGLGDELAKMVWTKIKTLRNSPTVNNK